MTVSVFHDIEKGCELCEKCAMQGYKIGYERGYRDAQIECKKKIEAHENAFLKRLRELTTIEQED